MGRTEMSKRELGRVEVLGRVRSQELRLVDAAALLRLSYRQTKRLWRRYWEEKGAARPEDYHRRRPTTRTRAKAKAKEQEQKPKRGHF